MQLTYQLNTVDNQQNETQHTVSDRDAGSPSAHSELIRGLDGENGSFTCKRDMA